MAVFNRVYCDSCKKELNVYDEKLRDAKCPRCGHGIKINPKDGNFFIEFYAEGRRRREKIGSSRALAEIVLKKRKVEVAENKFLDVKKGLKVLFDDFVQEYYELHSKQNNKSWFRTDRHNIKVLKDFFGGKRLTEITPHLIEEFRKERLKAVKLT